MACNGPSTRLDLRTPEHQPPPQHLEDGWFGHIGFVVPNMQTFMDNVPGKVAGRDMAEYRVWDPEGNAIDLSQQRGFEVDYDRWERAS